MSFKYSDKGDMSAHIFMIYGVVRGIRPRSVLEIGIRGGVSTSAICQALEDANLNCEYSCCDIHSSVKSIQKRTQVPLDFRIMSSDTLALVWDKPIDLLFIDGCHEYSQVKRDYLNFSKFVTKDGFIFLHDTRPPLDKRTPEYSWDAHRILEDLKKDDSIEFVTFPYSFGLTVCRKLV